MEKFNTSKFIQFTFYILHYYVNERPIFCLKEEVIFKESFFCLKKKICT